MMDHAEFGLMALLLSTAILMSLLGYVIGRGMEGMRPMDKWERAGLIILMATMALPLIAFGAFDVVSIAAIIMAVVVCVIALSFGTERWYAAISRLRRMHRPVVESYMLSLDDLGLQIDESVPNAEGGAVWVYACNSGKGKAKSVQIETNIPSEMVNAQIWQDGEISRTIDVLDPELPVCIGVVRPKERSPDPFWISFEYQSESEVRYRERYELVM